MELKEIVSIAGIGGLKKIIKQRPDGLIISELDGSGKKFMSNRIHMFTPLENISIYTDNDSEPLAAVLWKMKNMLEECPPVSPKASADELKGYMSKILPEYDRDQVFISDIKKLVKWFATLNELDMISNPEDKVTEEEDKNEDIDKKDDTEAESVE